MWKLAYILLENLFMHQVGHNLSFFNTIFLVHITGVPNLWPSRPIYIVALHPSFKIFFWPCWLWRNLVTITDETRSFKCSEYLQFKFFACHIFDFSKNQMLPPGQFCNLISHTQQVVSIFCTAYHFQQFSQMEHVSSWLCLQLSNHHLPSVNLYI